MRYYFYILILSLILGCSSSYAKGKGKVCFNDKCVVVEIAETREQLIKGLQFRQELCNNCGMIFIFPSSGDYKFWMKDTLIPLDIIWLDSARRIVHIEKNVPPCKKNPCASYSPGQNSRYVIELNTGKSDLLGIKLGDIVEFRRLNRIGQ